VVSVPAYRPRASVVTTCVPTRDGPTTAAQLEMPDRQRLFMHFAIRDVYLYACKFFLYFFRRTDLPDFFTFASFILRGSWM